MVEVLTSLGCVSAGHLQVVGWELMGLLEVQCRTAMPAVMAGADCGRLVEVGVSGCCRTKPGQG